jgi:hypothetical protein
MPFITALAQNHPGRGFNASGKKPDAPTSLSATARRYTTYDRFYSTSI